MKYVGDKVSYVRNPFARNSYYCLGLAILSLGLGAGSMYLSVARAGQGGLNTGVWECGSGCCHLRKRSVITYWQKLVSVSAWCC